MKPVYQGKVKLHANISRTDKSAVIELSDGEMLPIDFAFPILHGSFGEDGKIQGFFETMGLPYAGSGVCASALAMDKVMTRHVADSLGISQADFLCINDYEYRLNSEQLLEKIQNRMNFPVFVKPVNLGSSVGISKARGYGFIKREYSKCISI